MTRHQWLAAFITWIATACGAGPAPSGPPDSTLEQRAVAATRPDRPVQVVFSWSAVEREGRYSGRGVARIEPPYRARLDLFGPRGDTYLSAALVEHDLRLPPGAPPATLPPPALMWGVLGVVAPPPGAELVATERTESGLLLEYREDRGRLRYELAGDALRAVRWDGPGAARLTVEIEAGDAAGLPVRAEYRDWAAFVELNLTREEVEHVEQFPDEIWQPGR